VTCERRWKGAWAAIPSGLTAAWLREAFGVAFVTALLFCVSSSNAGSNGATVAGLGEAGAVSLSGRGVDAPWGNPATLAWDDDLYVRVVSGSGLIQNDTYTWHDYGRWNGSSWTEDDKREILGRVGQGGVHGRFETGLLTPAVAGSGWALTGRNVQAGELRLPREYVDLVLFGNQLGQSIDLPASTGEGLWFFDLAVSHGRTLGTWREFEISTGATLHWLRGFQYRELLRAGGSLTTDIDALDGELTAESRTSEGGTGWALDIGIALRSSDPEPVPGMSKPGIHGPFEIGLALRDVAGSIRWSRSPRMHLDRAYADSVTLADAEDEDPIETTSQAYPINAFTQSIPAETSLAAAMWVSEVRLELDWTQGFEAGPLSSTTPRFALGGSYRRWPWLTPRAGLAFGGVDGPVVAVGARLRFSLFDLDLAYQNVGGVDISLPKGIALGVALTLRPLEGRESP
jgi:hypothetical protein